jgi:hypothetical protein
MTAPTNHHLTVTDQHGKQIRGKVVYLQPKAERWREQCAVVHIVSSDWLDPYGYDALYSTPTQSISGHYSLHSYDDAEGQWLFKGTFDVVEGGSGHADQ